MIYVIMYRGVYRRDGQISWPALATIFITGAVTAGAGVGFLLGAMGAALTNDSRTIIVALLALNAVIIGALGTFGVNVPLVQLNRETPRELLFSHPFSGTFATGAMIGTGFVTRIGFWLWYVVPVAAFASGSTFAGALLFGTYALARSGAPAIMVALIARADPDGRQRRGHHVQDRLTGRIRGMRLASALLLVAVGVSYLV